MKLRLFALPLLTAIVFGLLAVSCSKEKKLLEVIPSSVDFVGTVRLKSALEKGGCKYENGSAVIPSGVSDTERLTNLVTLIGSMDASGVCNPDETVCGHSADGTVFMVLSVGDRKKFKEATAGEIDWTDETGGYTCGSVGSMAVLLDDSRVWFVGAKPSDAVGVVDGLIKDAGKSSIGSMTGIAQLLSEDNLVNIAVRQVDVPAKEKKGAKGENPALEVKWATLTLNVQDNKLVGNSSMMEADGKPVAVAGMQEINQAVLAYVPENFNVALGFGVTPDFDWSLLTKSAGAFGGFQGQAMLTAVIPYLQSIDGTIFVAAGPANSEAYSDIEPGNWQFIAMVHLPQQKINDIMGMMRSSMFMAGVSPKEKDGIMMIPQYGMNIYMGNVDGYLAVSNIPFEDNRQNSLAPVFNGKVGALSLSLPTLKVFGDGMPDYGVGVKVQMNPDNATGELVLTGTDRPILEVLLAAFV